MKVLFFIDQISENVREGDVVEHEGKLWLHVPLPGQSEKYLQTHFGYFAWSRNGWQRNGEMVRNGEMEKWGQTRFIEWDKLPCENH